MNHLLSFLFLYIDHSLYFCRDREAESVDRTYAQHRTHQPLLVTLFHNYNQLLSVHDFGRTLPLGHVEALRETASAPWWSTTFCRWCTKPVRDRVLSARRATSMYVYPVRRRHFFTPKRAHENAFPLLHCVCQKQRKRSYL